MAKLKVKKVRSAINRTARQKKTLLALGLRKMNQVVEHDDTSAVQGMIAKVQHLVSVEKA
jgi:large subunit ribosomal protein L30